MPTVKMRKKTYTGSRSYAGAPKARASYTDKHRAAGGKTKAAKAMKTIRKYKKK